jgi:hypothetical protein
MVYFRVGDEAMIFDFSDPDNPRRITDVNPDDRFPSGKGTDQPIIFKDNE